MGKQLVYPLEPENDDLPPHMKEFYFERLADGVFILHVETDDGRHITTRIRSFDDAAWLQYEASEALAAMIADVRAAPYPARRFSEIMRRATRPDVSRSRVQYDPATGTYDFNIPFPKRAPLSFKLTEDDLECLRAKQDAARALARKGR